jgi:hypothetical protein
MPEGASVPIARITTSGLTAMAASVILLWSCLISEQVLVRRAVREQAEVLRDINRLRQRQRSQPVDAPLPQHPGLPRPAAG